MLFGTPWEFISAPGPWISECVMDGLCCKAIHYVYYPSGPKMGSAARLNWVQTHGLPWRVLHCVWDWVRTVPRGRSWVWELYRIGGAARRVSESQLPDLQHPTKNWQQKQIRSYAFFILFILFLCLICCKSQLIGPSLHRERPLLRSCGWSFASCQPPSHSDTHLFPLQDVENLLSCCTESCFFFSWKNGALNLPSTFT